MSQAWAAVPEEGAGFILLWGIPSRFGESRAGLWGPDIWFLFLAVPLTPVCPRELTEPLSASVSSSEKWASELRGALVSILRGHVA